MSEQNKTSFGEPWLIGEDIVTADGSAIELDCSGEMTERIVACVNFCAGFPQEQMEIFGTEGKSS